MTLSYVILDAHSVYQVQTNYTTLCASKQLYISEFLKSEKILLSDKLTNAYTLGHFSNGSFLQTCALYARTKCAKSNIIGVLFNPWFFQTQS
jgi:hypothetical protein